ncbi:hypothetical protein, conserved [Eimeria necatrix]|uniref:Uncharacterized protein n=1 Tax=Eimeria necatrix TaxID=51315 RepID=U6N3K3_9EIME|nr:hypothetical protein, conserved [Eimeria necatrix]CDJ69889.1 hypothetical protein, conserved [Eimeria necatrix]
MAEAAWTPELLSRRYEEIKSCIPQQLEAYGRFLREAAPEDLRRWQQIAEDLKLELNLENGRIKYKKEFQPLELPVEICYIRHGKTEGNTEPRVFQGQVDYANNQLTQQGQQQAAAAAAKLAAMAAAKEFLPDLLLSSPLLRAVQTAQPFVDANPKPFFRVLPELAEMAFGEWDNQKARNTF